MPADDEKSLDPVEKLQRGSAHRGRNPRPAGCLTRPEAARALGVSIDTVRRREGIDLEVIRSGSSVYITDASVRKAASYNAEAPDGETTAKVFELLQAHTTLAQIAVQLRLPGRVVASVFDEWQELARRDARMVPQAAPAVCRQCKEAEATLCPACVSAAMASVAPAPAEVAPCVTGCGETASIHVCPACVITARRTRTQTAEGTRVALSFGVGEESREVASELVKAEASS